MVNGGDKMETENHKNTAAAGGKSLQFLTLKLLFKLLVLSILYFSISSPLCIFTFLLYLLIILSAVCCFYLHTTANSSYMKTYLVIKKENKRILILKPKL